MEIPTLGVVYMQTIILCGTLFHKNVPSQWIYLMCEPVQLCVRLWERVFVCMCAPGGRVFHFYLSHPLEKSHTAFNHLSALLNTIWISSGKLFSEYTLPLLYQHIVPYLIIIFLHHLWGSHLLCKLDRSLSLCLCLGHNFNPATHSVAHFWTWKTEIRALLNIAPKLWATCC